MAYAQVQDVKSWLKTTSPVDDALVSRLIDSASQFIDTFLGRTLLTSSYTETYSARGSRGIAFRNYPVTAVSSVTVDGIAIPFASNILQYGYVFSDKIIFTPRNTYWSTETQNVVISYTAGYASIPADITQATIDIVAYWYRQRDRVGTIAHSTNGVNTDTFQVCDIPGAAQTIIDRYRSVRI